MPIGFFSPGTRQCGRCKTDLAGLRITRVLCDNCEYCFIEGCQRPSSGGWCPMHRARKYNKRRRGKGGLGGVESIRVVGERIPCFRCGGKTVTRGGGRPLCPDCRQRTRVANELNKNFGIGIEEYDKMLELQDGRCAICGCLPRTKRLAVDHCHESKAIRGLLCSRCNKGLLGGAHDSVDLLKRAIVYLETPPAGGLGLKAEGRL